MIDPTSHDWCGDNTTRAQRKKDNQWLLRLSLVVIGFALITMILWSV